MAPEEETKLCSPCPALPCLPIQLLQLHSPNQMYTSTNAVHLFIIPLLLPNSAARGIYDTNYVMNSNELT